MAKVVDGDEPQILAARLTNKPIFVTVSRPHAKEYTSRIWDEDLKNDLGRTMHGMEKAEWMNENLLRNVTVEELMGW